MSNDIDRLTTALADRYRIERELGSGGMATVYLAEDVKHKRHVALKVLKPELAHALGPERFLREIKITARLTHPHILPLLDSGEADGFLFYVMPFVEGETLRDRLDREKQLSIDDAVQIAREIADALSYANSHDVLHRDIKPENILLESGHAVVADFGIARAISAAGGDRLTETGLAIGTPSYMSPEQATAEKDLTNRSDIYSLGCVLYEMLTGEPPHTGASAQAIVMKIVTEDVQPVTELRKSVPPHVAAATAKSLEKLAADRFATAAKFAETLTNPSFTLPMTQRAVVSARANGLRNRVALVGWSLAIVFAMLFVWHFSRPGPPRLVSRFNVTPTEGQQLAAVGGVRVALSSDGARIVYVGETPSGGTQLWQRALQNLEADPIPGTDGARNPVLSPDGRSVAFQFDGGLRTISLSGGPPFPVSRRGLTPSWGADGMVYFAEGGIIHRVPASGGEPEAVTSPTDGPQYYPQPLPDGRGLVLTVLGSLAAQSRIAVVGPDGGEVRELFPGTMARYAASGHIVYTTADGTLKAAPFDLKRLVVTGQHVAMLEGVEVRSTGTESQFALSENGTLLYGTTAGGVDAELVWVSRDGIVEAVDPAWTGDFWNPTLSPDGSRVALDVRERGTAEIWVKTTR